MGMKVQGGRMTLGRLSRWVGLAGAATLLIACIGVSSALAATKRHCERHWGGPQGLTFTGMDSVNTTCSTAKLVYRKAKRRHYPYEVYTAGRWWTRIVNDRAPEASSWVYWGGGERRVIIVRI